MQLFFLQPLPFSFPLAAFRQKARKIAFVTPVTAILANAELLKRYPADASHAVAALANAELPKQLPADVPLANAVPANAELIAIEDGGKFKITSPIFLS